MYYPKQIMFRVAHILYSPTHAEVCQPHKIQTLSKHHRLSGGELFDYLTQKDFLDEVEATHYMKQILEGMAYTHAQNIVHLDLKASDNADRIRKKEENLFELG